MSRFILSVLLISFALISDGAEPLFRTDGGDAKLPWFQVKTGEFPPEGASHTISGGLISIDQINRSGMLRPDRDDTQRRGEWDIARPFVMLPYGTFMYHGAPAALRDIPLGTHLFGQFFADEKIPKKGEPTFTRTILLEDDFSRFQRLKQSWRIDAIDLETGTLTVTRIMPEGPAPGKPILFKVAPTTKVRKGRGFGTLADLAAGQNVLINLTVCTLKGPGRATDIWLDEESRKLSTEQQREQHLLYQREHGPAGWVNRVDHEKGVVTVSLFSGVDPSLLEAFKVNEACAAAVAEDSLRTYDQINDVKRGPITEILKETPGPGNSGVVVRFRPSELLEGYRPTRIVRLFASGWKVDDLPREEKLYK